MKLKNIRIAPIKICGGFALLALFLTGCETTGLSARERGKSSYSDFVYQIARNPPAQERPRPLQRPVRLAVAQIGEVAPPTDVLARLRSESDLIASAIALPLPGETQRASQGFPTQEKPPAPDAGANRVAEICQLARSLGADEVLVFGGTIDTYVSRNALAPLDFTLVGMTIFPSAKIHGEGKAAGVLINAESQAVRFQVEAERRNSNLAPSAFQYEETDSLRIKMRDDLAMQLTEKFIRKLRNE
jgi:hypothetical protein